MKHYCKSCGAEFKSGNAAKDIDIGKIRRCMFCDRLNHGESTVKIAPDYETPGQPGYYRWRKFGQKPGRGHRYG